jgi:archaellum component FlaC
MDDTLKRSDLDGLRQDLHRLEKRMDAGFEGVDKRLEGVDKRLEGVDKRLEGVDKRLDGLDTGLHRLEIVVDSVKDDVTRIADGLAGATSTLGSHVRKDDAVHRRLERMILAGDAALDKRVTALEKGPHGRRT